MRPLKSRRKVNWLWACRDTVALANAMIVEVSVSTREERPSWTFGRPPDLSARDGSGLPRFENQIGVFTDKRLMPRWEGGRSRIQFPP